MIMVDKKAKVKEGTNILRALDSPFALCCNSALPAEIFPNNTGKRVLQSAFYVHNRINILLQSATTRRSGG